MASNLPRVTAYITPESRAALDAVSTALGESRSKFVGQLIEAAIPVMWGLVEAAEQLRTYDDRQRAALASIAADLEPMKDEAESLMGRVLHLVGGSADALTPPK